MSFPGEEEKETSRCQNQRIRIDETLETQREREREDHHLQVHCNQASAKQRQLRRIKLGSDEIIRGLGKGKEYPFNPETGFIGEFERRVMEEFGLEGGINIEEG